MNEELIQIVEEYGNEWLIKNDHLKIMKFEFKIKKQRNKMKRKGLK